MNHTLPIASATSNWRPWREAAQPYKTESPRVKLEWKINTCR